MSVDFFSTTINTTIYKKIIKLFDSGFISSGKKNDEFEKLISTPKRLIFINGLISNWENGEWLFDINLQQ